ncbi:MAG: DUF1176 domain-containing protein [Hyphomicrobiales bacterium]|nr:DUF1176 domain-containing protein [Hyphomicrobiales bacterium]
MRRLAPLLVAVGLLALAAPAAAEPVTTEIGGWKVACDAPVCRASLPSASGEQALLLGRFEIGDGVAIGLATPGAFADPDRPMTLRIDGRAIADIEPKSGHRAYEKPENLWIVEPKLVEAILAARAPVKSLRIEYIDVIGAPHDADFDLADLARVLAWTAERLGRSADKAVGVAPKGLVVAPETSRAELVARLGVPPRLARKHMTVSECEAPNSPLLRAFKPVIGVLSSTATLYAIPCTASAGNVSFRVWVLENGEIGGLTPQYFATFDPALGWRGTDLLHNVAYDEKTQRLTSTFRAGGGCGARGVWRWKKWTFEMLETRLAETCEGKPPTDWPVVWAAPAP